MGYGSAHRTLAQHARSPGLDPSPSPRKLSMPVIPLREEARVSEVQGHPLSPSMAPSWSGLQETLSQKHAKEHNNVDELQKVFS